MGSHSPSRILDHAHPPRLAKRIRDKPVCSHSPQPRGLDSSFCMMFLRQSLDYASVPLTQQHPGIAFVSCNPTRNHQLTRNAPRSNSASSTTNMVARAHPGNATAPHWQWTRISVPFPHSDQSKHLDPPSVSSRIPSNLTCKNANVILSSSVMPSDSFGAGPFAHCVHLCRSPPLHRL